MNSLPVQCVRERLPALRQHGVALEESIGDERMQVRMETEVFAEGMDGHDRTENALGQLQDFALVVDQAVARAA